MRKVRKLKGALAPIITVFKPDESIDEEGTVKHTRWLLDNGIQGLIVCGSTGESISMTIEERKRIAELIIDEFGNDVPICVATGDYRTKNTIELSKHAEDLGADCLLILVPYYMGLTKAQVFEYYKDITKNVSIPVLLYDNPYTSGISVDVQEIKKYFDLGFIHGTKLALGEASQVHDLRYLCGKEFSIFYGADPCALEALLCGADGWISGILNLIPKICRELCDAALAGNRDEAWKIWEKILPLIQLELFLDENREPHWLSFIKSGLEIIGHDVGKPRKPMLLLSNEHKEKIAEIISKMKLS